MGWGSDPICIGCLIAWALAAKRCHVRKTRRKKRGVLGAVPSWTAWLDRRARWRPLFRRVRGKPSRTMGALGLGLQKT